MKKVAIVGAGISGLYLANELNKNTEIDYKIFEKKDYLNLNEGYGIQLSVNSINLLNKIGFKNMFKKIRYGSSSVCTYIHYSPVLYFVYTSLPPTTVLITFTSKIFSSFDINNLAVSFIFS